MSVLQAKLFWPLLIFLGSSLASHFVDNKFYTQVLIKPKWAPPPWVYGVVWTALYILESFATIWLQWNEATNNGHWSVDLTLYLSWYLFSQFFMFIFFKLKNLGASVLIMLASEGMLIATLYFFFTNTTLSGWLLFPTLVWHTLALYTLCVIFYQNIGNPLIVRKPGQLYSIILPSS